MALLRTTKLFLIAALFSVTLLGAEESDNSFLQEDELLSIENMISATQKQLDLQKEIRALMEEFKSCRYLFMYEDHSKKYAARMVEIASTLLGKIQDHHLEHAFSSSYLKELAVFASIATKKSLKSS